MTRRNRYCPKCQGSAAREWLAHRQAELPPGAADESECCITDFSEDLRSGICADRASVLAVGHIANVKQADLDLPMIA